jgi:hypothetical protein
MTLGYCLVQAFPQGRRPDVPSGIPEDQADALSEALLVRWAHENVAITEAREIPPPADSAADPCAQQIQASVGLRVVDISQYKSFHQMPFALRTCVEPFCIHPRLLHVAEVQAVNSPQGCGFAMSVSAYANCLADYADKNAVKNHIFTILG